MAVQNYEATIRLKPSNIAGKIRFAAARADYLFVVLECRESNLTILSRQLSNDCVEPQPSAFAVVKRQCVADYQKIS